MLFPQTAQYAMRAMATLASLPPGDALPARDLADLTGIPPHYLSKIMRKLVLHKLVSSRKGHGGGFQLARAARSIRFLDIFSAVDYQLGNGLCAYGWGRCNPDNHCPLHDSFQSLQDQVSSWLEGRTLDGVGRDGRLD